MKAKQIATYGLLTAIAMALSFLESLLPPLTAVPGIKLGLANIAVMFALYRLGTAAACSISLLRVVLVAFTFGNAFALLYSLAGAILSMVIMLALKRTGVFSVTGVSIAGGVAHNLGQISMAALVAETPGLLYYIPVLLVSGVAAGVCIGVLTGVLVKRVCL